MRTGDWLSRCRKFHFLACFRSQYSFVLWSSAKEYYISLFFFIIRYRTKLASVLCGLITDLLLLLKCLQFSCLTLINSICAALKIYWLIYKLSCGEDRAFSILPSLIVPVLAQKCSKPLAWSHLSMKNIIFSNWAWKICFYTFKSCNDKAPHVGMWKNLLYSSYNLNLSIFLMNASGSKHF